MKIADRDIVPDSPPYIIAEIGVNHDGDVHLASNLIDQAASVGVDAVKFQFFQAERLMSRQASLATYQEAAGETDPRDMLRRLELSIDDFARLRSHAALRRVHFIASVFSTELVESVASLEPDALKTASPDIIHRPMLETMVATGLPVLISTGASTMEEIKSALAWIGNTQHILMQCVSAYPTPDHLASIAALRDIRRLSPHALGYSDHTKALDTGALAVACGAVVLEKHFTHDRNAPGPDHAASLDAEGMQEYVRLCHRAHDMLGVPIKKVLDRELDVRGASRQSIVAVCDLCTGDVIRSEHLTTMRPGNGLPPASMASLIGRKIVRNVSAGSLLAATDFEGDLA